MDKHALARHRVRSQRLTSPPLASAEAVVGWLGAVQAQEYGLARWSVAQRTSGLTEAALDELLADGRIVRTHILRPTWHFVLPADIRWMMALTGPRILVHTGRRYTALGLDKAVLRRATEVLGEALAGGGRRTRPQVRALLAEAGIEVDASQLAYILMQAELEMLVCSGGLDGKQQTYALLDEVVPASEPLDRDEALAELTRRYFASHGPSTIADFTWWSSLTVGDARRGLAIVGGGLERLEFEGAAYWFDPSLADDEEPSPSAHLLQTFDEYIVGYQRTRSVIDAAGLSGPGTWNPNSYVNPVIVDGQIAGGWRRMNRGQGTQIELQPLRPFSAAEKRAVEAAAERYGAFVAAAPATISYTAAT